MYYKFKHLNKRAEDMWYSAPLRARQQIADPDHVLLINIIQHHNTIRQRLLNVNIYTPILSCYILACTYWFRILNLDHDYDPEFKVTSTYITMSWYRRPSQDGIRHHYLKA